jgi:valyl-tRNA synthetase
MRCATRWSPGAAVGTDIHLNYENLEEAFAPGRNFSNKLWNAGRFALMNLGDEPVQRPEDVAGTWSWRTAGSCRA